MYHYRNISSRDINECDEEEVAMLAMMSPPVFVEMVCDDATENLTETERARCHNMPGGYRYILTI